MDTNTMTTKTDGRARNGGARPGTGPKPQTMTLRTGDLLIINTVSADGFTGLQNVRVTVTARGRVQLTLETGPDAGMVYKLSKP